MGHFPGKPGGLFRFVFFRCAAILNLHERIENKLFLDRTRKDSNFKRPHICATLFQIEKCCWTSFGPTRKVTEASGPVLSTLDRKPALQLYCNYLGDKARELPSSGLLYPLALVGEG